jgi:hypothetical protein
MIDSYKVTIQPKDKGTFLELYTRLNEKLPHIDVSLDLIQKLCMTSYYLKNGEKNCSLWLLYPIQVGSEKQKLIDAHKKGSVKNIFITKEDIKSGLDSILNQAIDI